MIGIGSVVNGKYRLVRLLGDGGMGAVYEAQHSALGTRVAIKVLHAELARRTGLVERFMQEARVAAQIRSPYVVQVTDVDRTADGQAYIVMELLEGEPLSSVLDRQRKLPVSTACAYTLQILAALEAAHALGVIHRDLKPENVFVTFLAGRPVLKLIDFGIAKVRRLDPRQKNLTVAGVVMGTAEYMAPEQARSADKVDARADIYAAGVILYELIAGSRPVPGDEAQVIAMRVERGEAVPLVQVAPDVPRDVAGLVHRAMAARPELRFATATEMRLALEAAVSGAKRAGTAAMQAGSVAGGPSPAIDGTRTAGRMPAAAAPPPAPTSAGGPPSQAPEEPPVRTMRAPPLASALAPPAYAGAAVPASPQVSEGARRRRRNPGAVVALVAVPIFLGAGVVGVFLASGTSASGPPSPPLFPAATAADEAGIEPVAAATATATQPSPNSEVPSLVPTKPVYVAQHPLPSPSAHAVSSAGVDASAPTAAPFLLPTTLPSVFPSGLPPFPSGMLPPFPTSLPTALPTTLPTVFPGALPAWPQPPAEPSASAPSSPHPSNPGY